VERWGEVRDTAEGREKAGDEKLGEKTGGRTMCRARMGDG
jgi:hypothetical protein